MALKHLISALALVALAGACAQPAPSNPAPGASAPVSTVEGVHRELVTVQTSQGAVNFYAEIADNDEERARGLMSRREMAREHGMLFLFDEPGPQSFWMRNTHLSLDLIFIGADGRIVNIAERAVPYTDTAVRSTGPAIAVLEINGGLAREMGIAAGDRVQHPRIVR